MMVKRCVSGAWMVLLLGPLALHAGQLITASGFAQDNEVIILGTVLSVERLAPARQEREQREAVIECSEHRAVILVQRAFKGPTDEDTVTVEYATDCWRKTPPEFAGVDAEGHSLYVAGADLVVGDSYKLSEGEDVLLGLRVEDKRYRPGAGGFVAPPGMIPSIREELNRPRGGSDSNR